MAMRPPETAPAIMAFIGDSFFRIEYRTQSVEAKRNPKVPKFAK